MVTTSQTSKELNGVPTETLIQVFADRILVLVTQLGKVGNLVCFSDSVPDTGLSLRCADSG